MVVGHTCFSIISYELDFGYGCLDMMIRELCESAREGVRCRGDDRLRGGEQGGQGGY